MALASRLAIIAGGVGMYESSSHKLIYALIKMENKAALVRPRASFSIPKEPR